MDESLGDTIDRLHHSIAIRNKRIAELEDENEGLRELLKRWWEDGDDYLLVDETEAALKEKDDE